MTDTRTYAAVPETALDRGGRTAWGAILAGTIVGLAVYVLLTLLGIGLGLSAIEVDAEDPLGMVPTSAGIWVFLSQLIALFAGGFVGGRLAGVLHQVGAALHGATIWALTTLAALWLAASASMGLVNMTGSAISSAAGGIASATQAVMPDDFDVTLPDVAWSQIDFSDLPEPVQARLREEGLTPENFRREAREAFRSVISKAEQRRVRENVTETARDVIMAPGDAAEEIDDFVANTFGRGDVIGPEDREEAIAVMRERFGVTEAEAEDFVARMETRIAEARQDAVETLETAKAEALEAADTAADAMATAALLGALASLLGLIAAVLGGVLGRPIDID